MTAEDAAGNVGPPSNEASAIVGDTTAPSAPGTLTATGAIGQATLELGRRDGQRRRRPLQRPPLDDRRLHPGADEPDRAADGDELRRHRARRASTSTGSPPRTQPATSAPPSNEATRDGHDRHDSADARRQALAGPVSRQHGQPQLDGVDRQRRRRRATTSTAARRRVHPDDREPDRAADRHELRGRRARDGHLLLQGHRRGRGRQPQRALERAQRDRSPTRPRRRRRAASQPSAAGTLGLAQLDGRDRQRRRRPLQRPPRRRRAGFTPSAANRIAQPTGTSYTDTGLAARHVLLQGDRRGRRRQRRPGLEHRERDDRGHDRRRPRPAGLTATGGAGQAALSWTASTDNVGVVALQRPPLDDRRLHAVDRRTGSHSRPARATRTPVSPPAPTSTRSPPRTPPATSAPRRPRRSPTSTARRRRGLVAAYGFDAGSGTTAADQSGNGQHRHARERHVGRCGSRQVRQRALVQRHERARDRRRLGVARSDDRHDARGLGQADVGSAGSTRSSSRSARATSSTACTRAPTSNRPQSQVTVGSITSSSTAPHAIPAGRLDAPRRRRTTAATQRLYVNGTQVAHAARPPARSSPRPRPLKIGGNSIWGECFDGLIDEVRIYNRALTATEIQADMNTLDQLAGHRRAERARHARRATGGLGQIAPELGSGDRQRRRREVQRLPLDDLRVHARAPRNRIAQPTGTTLHGHGPGSRARTTTGSPPRTPPATSAPLGNEASAAATADTTPPTVSITAPDRRCDRLRHGDRHRERVGQRLGRRRPVQDRRRERRRGGHDRAVLGRLGHVRERQRPAHA